jgi:hypothetical protein
VVQVFHDESLIVCFEGEEKKDEVEVEEEVD